MIVIVGESGSGKTTLANALCKKHTSLKRIVTYTTRPKRQGEVDGVDYHFIDEAQFLRMVGEGAFLEYNHYRGWMYGTSLHGYEGEMHRKLIAVLTPAGMREINKVEVTTSFYLDVDRKSRLIKLLERGDDVDEAYRRSLSDVGQFDGIKNEVDYILTNTNFSRTPEELVKEMESKIYGV